MASGETGLTAGLSGLAKTLMPVPDPHPDVFDTRWPLRVADIDRVGRLKFDAACRHIQDVGSDQLREMGYEETHPLWIVRRTMIDLIRPIEFQDMLRMRRWCSGTSNRWCEMRVRIDGKRAKSETKLKQGQEVRIPPVTEKPKGAKPKLGDKAAAFMKSLVIYDDGDIIAINGIDELDIGCTVCDAQQPQAFPMLTVDEPTMTLGSVTGGSPATSGRR